jgi:predicted DNA binding CopG/RHH family protein
LEISEKNLKYIKEAVNADGFKKLAYQKAIEEEIENRSRKSIHLFC